MKKDQKWLFGVGLAIVVVLVLGLILVYLKLQTPVQPNNIVQNDNTISKNLNNQNNLNKTKQNCVGEECLQVSNLNYPVGTLSEDAKLSLVKAIEDEYKAKAVYQKVIDKLGNVRPFIMIIRAEEQHISSLKSLFDKYGLVIPQDKTSNLPEIDTLANACKIGVSAEIDNAKLYNDELIPSVTKYEDITLVFTNLMNASRDNHLKAFEKCAN